MKKDLDAFMLRRGSLVLMWLLLAVTLAAPLADSYPHIGAAMALITLGSVVAGARLSANKKIIVRVVFPVSGLWILARLLEGFGDRPGVYNFLAHVFGLVLSMAILWAIFDLLDTSEVTTSVIAEAFITYLILAIAFSQLFWLLNELFPDAFNEKLPPTQNADFLYFSMITISGVGYGGISPVNPFVRLIAALESMIGIFYIAVVVARLVSSYRPSTNRPDSGSV
jgi:hypothetical protein